MNAIDITGPPQPHLASLKADQWHIGDASGVDALAWDMARCDRYRYAPTGSAS